MAVNEKYSFGDFTGQTFLDVDPDEFSDSEIVGSCFAQENYNRRTIFPSGMHDVDFQKCNLDNVEVLANNTMDERCVNRRHAVQNDEQDWLVNSAGNPVAPLDVKLHDERGLSHNPADIPAHLIREMRVVKNQYDAAINWTARTTGGDKPVGDIDFWFKEKPEIIETTTKEETVRLASSWNETDRFSFDALPTMTEIEATELDVILNPDSGFQVGDIIWWDLTGNVTRYVISGKAWKFRGE